MHIVYNNNIQCNIYVMYIVYNNNTGSNTNTNETKLNPTPYTLNPKPQTLNNNTGPNTNTKETKTSNDPIYFIVLYLSMSHNKTYVCQQDAQNSARAHTATRT